MERSRDGASLPSGHPTLHQPPLSSPTCQPSILTAGQQGRLIKLEGVKNALLIVCYTTKAFYARTQINRNFWPYLGHWEPRMAKYVQTLIQMIWNCKLMAQPSLSPSCWWDKWQKQETSLVLLFLWNIQLLNQHLEATKISNIIYYVINVWSLPCWQYLSQHFNIFAWKFLL